MEKFYYAEKKMSYFAGEKPKQESQLLNVQLKNFKLLISVRHVNIFG
jgi:hypothetical protein